MLAQNFEHISRYLASCMCISQQMPASLLSIAVMFGDCCSSILCMACKFVHLWKKEIKEWQMQIRSLYLEDSSNDNISFSSEDCRASRKMLANKSRVLFPSSGW